MTKKENPLRILMEILGEYSQKSMEIGNSGERGAASQKFEKELNFQWD